MKRLRVLIRPAQAGEIFLAQCLEKNIAVRGNSPDDALSAFVERLAQFHELVQNHGSEDPLLYLGDGPKKAHRAWDGAFRGQTIRTMAPCQFEIETALARS